MADEKEGLFNSYDELAAQAMAIPDKYNEEEGRLLAINRKILGIQQKIKEIENDTFEKVCNAKDEDGKLLHSNDKKREIALAKALSKDETYTVFKQILMDGQKAEKDCGRELNFLKNQFKAIQVVAEIAKIKLNLR